MQPDTSTYIPYYWVLNGTCANSDKEGLESKEQAIQTSVISASVTSLIKVGANRTHFCEEIQRNDTVHNDKQGHGFYWGCLRHQVTCLIKALKLISAFKRNLCLKRTPQFIQVEVIVARKENSLIY